MPIFANVAGSWTIRGQVDGDCSFLIQSGRRPCGVEGRQSLGDFQRKEMDFFLNYLSRCTGEVRPGPVTRVRRGTSSSLLLTWRPNRPPSTCIVRDVLHFPRVEVSLSSFCSQLIL